MYILGEELFVSSTFSFKTSRKPTDLSWMKLFWLLTSIFRRSPHSRRPSQATLICSYFLFPLSHRAETITQSGSHTWKLKTPQQKILLMHIIKGVALPVESKAKVSANIPAATTLPAIKMKSTTVESPRCRLLRGKGKRSYWSLVCGYSCMHFHSAFLCISTASGHHREGSRLVEPLDSGKENIMT